MTLIYHERNIYIYINYKTIVKYLESLDGNIRVHLCDSNNPQLCIPDDIYFPVKNMLRIFDLTNPCRDIPKEILITPFILLENTATYELHYYETSIDTSDTESRVVEYAKGNGLPLEINKSICPRIILMPHEFDKFVDYLTHYLRAMSNMTFSDDFTALRLLAQGGLVL